MQLMRIFGAIATSLLLSALAHTAISEEDRFSEGNTWLREASSLLESISELQVPILMSSNTTASYVLGDIEYEEAEYILSARKNSLMMIKDSLRFGQSLMTEQPEKGGVRSGPFLEDIGNFNQKLDEIYLYSDQAMAGYEKTIKGDLTAYRDAELAMIQAVNRTSQLIDIYYRYKLGDYPTETHPDRSRFETIRYWELGFSAAIRILRLRMIEASLEDNLLAIQNLDTAVARLHEVIAKGRRDTAESIAELQRLPPDYPYFDVEERLGQLAYYEDWWSAEEGVALTFGELQLLLTAPELDHDIIAEKLDNVLEVAKIREVFDNRLLGIDGPSLTELRERMNDARPKVHQDADGQTPLEVSADSLD